jgi:hypothetical protein
LTSQVARVVVGVVGVVGAGHSKGGAGTLQRGNIPLFLFSRFSILQTLCTRYILFEGDKVTIDPGRLLYCTHYAVYLKDLLFTTGR